MGSKKDNVRRRNKLSQGGSEREMIKKNLTSYTLPETYGLPGPEKIQGGDLGKMRTGGILRRTGRPPNPKKKKKRNFRQEGGEVEEREPC